MAEYGITDQGFEIKRMDVILREIHEELTEGFGFDTTLTRPSFLDTLVTTFAGQIADLWELAQDSYYAKFPATATGINLDNAVQYGGIVREENRPSVYPIHCTGDDGTVVDEETMIATETLPEVRLLASEEFEISRENCNSMEVRVATVAAGTYSVAINEVTYSYTATAGDDQDDILDGLAEAITDNTYTVSSEDGVLMIEDTDLTRENDIELSENLTTKTVTTVADFETEEDGRIVITDGVVTKIVTDVVGLDSVVNKASPVYGQTMETDDELRQSYFDKAALKSTSMIESICGALLDDVDGVKTASGYQNDKDVTSSSGLPPHSVQIIVDGGEDRAVAEMILNKKAGGIQTYGSTTVSITTEYGDTVDVSFSRPSKKYGWLNINLIGAATEVPSNYEEIVQDSVLDYCKQLYAGEDLLIQLLLEGIYESVAGINFARILTATANDASTTPASNAYTEANITATQQQSIYIDRSRIEVTLNAT